MSNTVTWAAVVVDDLDDYLAAAAMTPLRSAALKAGQTDPFSRVMPRIASRIRNGILACKRNRVSETTNAVPPELHETACLMIIRSMQGRLPGVKLTTEQEGTLKDGLEFLKRISECKEPVSIPTNPMDPINVQSPGNVEVVTSTERVATRAKMEGL